MIIKTKNYNGKGKKHKLNQEDLAEMIGVTRQTISNWKLNETSPDLKPVQKLLYILFRFSIIILGGLM